MCELGAATSRCRVWLIDLDTSVGAARSAYLPAADRARLSKIVDTRERRRRRMAYSALRYLLGAWLGPRARAAHIRRASSGAPGLVGIPAIFSLSHTGRYGLVALARQGKLGVDLEVARSLAMPVGRRTQLAAAATTLGRRPLDPARDADLLQAWTRLEALAKATGDGIGSTLTALGVRAKADPVPAASPPSRGHYFVVTDLRLPAGLYGAVAHSTRPGLQSSPARLRR